MLRYVLLVTTLMWFTVAMERGCEWDLQFFEVGYKFKEGCETCKCKKNGKVTCTENTPCCLYSVGRGRTRRARPGQSYKDGCNTCRCGDDGMGACTRMYCVDKCRYQNWDLVWGWVSRGRVQVYNKEGEGDGYGCPMDCKCKVKKGKAAVLDCSKGSCYYD